MIEDPLSKFFSRILKNHGPSHEAIRKVLEDRISALLEKDEIELWNEHSDVILKFVDTPRKVVRFIDTWQSRVKELSDISSFDLMIYVVIEALYPDLYSWTLNNVVLLVEAHPLSGPTLFRADELRNRIRDAIAALDNQYISLLSLLFPRIQEALDLRPSSRRKEERRLYKYANWVELTCPATEVRVDLLNDIYTQENELYATDALKAWIEMQSEDNAIQVNRYRRLLESHLDHNDIDLFMKVVRTHGRMIRKILMSRYIVRTELHVAFVGILFNRLLEMDYDRRWFVVREIVLDYRIADYIAVRVVRGFTDSKKPDVRLPAPDAEHLKSMLCSRIFKFSQENSVLYASDAPIEMLTYWYLHCDRAQLKEWMVDVVRDSASAELLIELHYAMTWPRPEVLSQRRLAEINDFVGLGNLLRSLEKIDYPQILNAIDLNRVINAIRDYLSRQENDDSAAI